MHTGFLATSIKYLLIFTVAFGCTFFMTFLARKRARFRDGWYYLTPGPMMWFALVGGALMTALFCYVYFFVGSARADAATQMKWLFGLIVAFDILTLFTAYAMMADIVRWDDMCIERRTLLFQIRRMNWNELSDIGIEGASGYWWISRFAGPRIRFSPYYGGFEQLMQKIVSHMPKDPPPAEIATAMEAALMAAKPS
jgi:hypothetical protein